MKTKALSIRLYGKPVGILMQQKNSRMVFVYDLKSDIQAISLAMPIGSRPYGEQECQAFFGGLLPESEYVRQAIAKRYQISPHNNFALLKAIGYDCAGAISCHELDEQITPHSFFLLEGTIIDQDELYQHIKDLPKKPLFMDVSGLRLSLAGVQNKAAICLIENEIAFPLNGCPTTHILKPSFDGYEGIVQNEYFCLQLAKRIGLAVPSVEIRKARDIDFLLIERYDRKIFQGKVSRIHQEDFCQALGIKSSKKYQAEGGPDFGKCFALLENTTQIAVNRYSLVVALIFNYLIGNMDAHGKNFSLLHESATDIRLAPFYDMICTLVYPELTKKMAMKIGGEYQVDMIFQRHWEKLATEIDFKFAPLAKLIEQSAESILKAMIEQKNEMIAQNLMHPIIDKIIAVIQKQADGVLAELKRGKK